MGVERLVYFSDAVIAIAITLLVIELRLPEEAGALLRTDQDLLDALASIRGRLLAFGISFAVIALWWYGHVRLARQLAAVDSKLVALNFVFLGSIAFMPFPTAVIGTHGDLPSAVIFYAIANLVTAMSLWVMRLRAGSAGLFALNVTARERHARLVRGVVPPAVFLGSIPIALISPPAAMLSWNLIWIILLAIRFTGRREERERALEREIG